VTSRRDLIIDGAEPLVLDAMTGGEGMGLFGRAVGTDRVAAEPEEEEEEEEVVRLCGELPLAIWIAASRLRKRPEWPIAYFAGRLS
jgi:hypothetical protein